MRASVIIVSCLLWCACDDTTSGPMGPEAGGGAQGAGGNADAAVEACDLVAPTACPDPMPRYDDVRPIFETRCTSCHNGMGEEWPLNSYQHVADWYGEIRAQMLACTMPPLDSGLTMPLAERRKILDWIRCGFPR